MKKFLEKYSIPIVATLGFFFVVLLSLAVSLIPAIVVGGLLAWITGFDFVSLVIFVWVLTIIFGRNR
jgi:predicted membrane metal-binding protein